MAPLERYFKLPEDKRERLIAAARAEFAMHGFERASFNRIIEAADVSKGAMYYYFADKADLFGEVIERLVVELIAKVGPLRDARDADDFWASLLEWVQAATLAVLSSPDLAALGRSLYHESGAQSVVVRFRELVLDVVEQTLQRGQALKAVRRDVPTDMLAAGMTHLMLALDRWFAERMDKLPPAEVERLSGKAFELCRDLAAPKPVPLRADKRKPKPKRRKLP